MDPSLDVNLVSPDGQGLSGSYCAVHGCTWREADWPFINEYLRDHLDEQDLRGPWTSVQWAELVDNFRAHRNTPYVLLDLIFKNYYIQSEHSNLTPQWTEDLMNGYYTRMLLYLWTLHRSIRLEVDLHEVRLLWMEPDNWIQCYLK